MFRAVISNPLSRLRGTYVLLFATKPRTLVRAGEHARRLLRWQFKQIMFLLNS